jgi:hypothetical protein
VAETKFSPGIGLAHVPGGVTTSFRVLLEIMDNSSGATRDEATDTLKVTRRCACALRDTESAETYLLTQNGPLDVTTLLLQVRKNEYVHAIVSWRSSDAISLNAFWALPAVEVTKFRQFFQKECEIFAAMATGTDLKLKGEVDETPLRIVNTASTVPTVGVSLPWEERTLLA